ncbi:hypothetical protein B0T16DRAFT_423835 [Cercophora newfieldiana]|uniref:Uncharacterized protein n=1 Tax=Cercophora newfieldiana TaxID=92897 RepID=A0AA40CIN1_9PEZI|nr:hypothetical protein B0T16DRAFT_423835 [Cercophora newfieldiana]
MLRRADPTSPPPLPTWDESCTPRTTRQPAGNKPNPTDKLQEQNSSHHPTETRAWPSGMALNTQHSPYRAVQDS